MIKQELFRKSIHMLFIFTIPLMSYTSERVAQLLLIVFGLLYYLFEQMRLKNKDIPLLTKITQYARRPQEYNTMALAPLTLAIGIVLTMELYDNMQAVKIAIVASTLGDSCAAIIGRMFPKPALFWNRKKSWSGFIANFVSVSGGVFFLTTPFNALILGISSAGVESLDLEHIDNLVVPLFVGAIWYFL